MRNPKPNKITGANAGGARQFAIRTRWAACVAQFCRWRHYAHSMARTFFIAMGLFSFLFGGCSKQPAPLASKFHAGQVWAFTPPTNQPNARLTVLRVESGGKLGTIVHIAISGVSYGDGQMQIQHLPFAEAAVERSLTTLERESGPVPDFANG
jgi:hypothetical protein